MPGMNGAPCVEFCHIVRIMQSSSRIVLISGSDNFVPDISMLQDPQAQNVLFGVDLT